MLKVIFLDVDGVLNYKGCKAFYSGYMGISENKVKLLKKVVDLTDAKLVLSSTWRIPNIPRYLINKLKWKGLFLYDALPIMNNERGKEIVYWLNHHPNVEKWVVLDDEIFGDFETQGIMPHLVKTESSSGLLESHVQEIVAKLK